MLLMEILIRDWSNNGEGASITLDLRGITKIVPFNFKLVKLWLEKRPRVAASPRKALARIASP
jgi:hypothetical protein